MRQGLNVAQADFIFGFPDRVSLSSPSCPGTSSVDQAGLEFTEIYLCFLSAGIKSIGHHHWLGRPFCSSVAENDIDLLILLSPLSRARLVGMCYHT